MASSDDIPSLSDLRRRRAPSRPAKASPSSPARSALREKSNRLPGLFDDPADNFSANPGSNLKENPEPQRPHPGASQPPATPEAQPIAEPPPAEPRVWSVGDLVRRVRGLVERSYGQVSVEGEISNWRPAGSGHCYFTLKDRDAQLSAVMFRRQAALLRWRPKDGDAVRMRGQLSIYESRGQMQLIAETMEQQGIGAMLAAVRELKERLRREGLFDRKRPLPAFPRCIGVVTSAQGAALRDIVKVCRRRHAAVNLLVYPAAVQGPRCAIEVAAGVRWFSVNAKPSAHPGRAVDVVIVARGGGSWEDLHGFDDERIARAIAACAVPVITGIGHAIDSTIADAAADVCAPTPSAAAELVTAAQHRIDERLRQLSSRLTRAGSYELLRSRQRLSRLSAEVVLQRVRHGLSQRMQRLDELAFRADAAALRATRTRTQRLARTESRLRRQHPSLRLAESQRRLQALRMKLHTAPSRSLAAAQARLERTSSRLHALSPLRVLERGYALVYGPDGRLLRSAGAIAEGQDIMARLAEGRLRARVTSKS